MSTSIRASVDIMLVKQIVKTGPSLQLRIQHCLRQCISFALLYSTLRCCCEQHLHTTQWILTRWMFQRKTMPTCLMNHWATCICKCFVFVFVIKYQDLLWQRHTSTRYRRRLQWMSCRKSLQVIRWHWLFWARIRRRHNLHLFISHWDNEWNKQKMCIFTLNVSFVGCIISWCIRSLHHCFDMPFVK